MAIAPHLATKCAKLEHLNLKYATKFGDAFLKFLCETSENVEGTEVQQQNLPCLTRLAMTKGYGSADALEYFIDNRKVQFSFF